MEQEPVIIGVIGDGNFALKNAIREAAMQHRQSLVVENEDILARGGYMDFSDPFSDTRFASTVMSLRPTPQYDYSPMLKNAMSIPNPRNPLTPKQVEKRRKKNQRAKKARKITRNNK